MSGRAALERVAFGRMAFGRVAFGRMAFGRMALGRMALAVILAAVPLGSGCVYYNSIYNAERLYAEAERARVGGMDSLAAARYGQVIRKAAGGYRRDPAGPWSDDALLLLGRAYLRQGELARAREALRRAAATADQDSTRFAALLYLGVARITGGDAAGGLPLVNQAIQALPPGPVRGEGHLWRARVLLAGGHVDQGLWDLDQASAADDGLRLEAALEGIRWGVRYGDLARTRKGLAILLRYGRGGLRADSVVTLMRGAARDWGPEEAAALLAGVDSARWVRPDRAPLLLARAELRWEAEDTSGAFSDLRKVADGAGAPAVEARLRLARRMLARARQIQDAAAVVPVLLPAEGHGAIDLLLHDVRAFGGLADAGLENPVAAFAAAEIAADRLGAPDLARGLYAFFAESSPDSPWAAKALLAELALTRDEGERGLLRARLEGLSRSPYVLAARGQAAPGMEVLEARLARRIAELMQRLAPETRRSPREAPREDPVTAPNHPESPGR